MSIRRTIYGAVDQLANFAGCPVPAVLQTTPSINKELNIQPDAVAEAGDIRRLRAVVFGIGAHTYTTGVQGIALPDTKNHTSRDAGLFMPIPAAVREVGNDLSEAMRARMAFREIKNINGVDHIVYWGYRVDASNSTIGVEELTVENGRVTSRVPFTPLASDRAPEYIDMNSQEANILSGKALSAYVPVPVELDSAAVSEILNAATILYGSPRYAYVSEIGFVSGADRVVQSPNGAGTITFNEIIAGNIAAHAPTMIAMSARGSGLSMTFNITGTEALLVREG